MLDYPDTFREYIKAGNSPSLGESRKVYRKYKKEIYKLILEYFGFEAIDYVIDNCTVIPSIHYKMVKLAEEAVLNEDYI